VRLSLIQLSAFRRKWDQLKLTDDDLRELEMSIVADPTRPPVMRGTGGLRKVRFAPTASGAGKSGGIRVCYAYLPQFELVYLCAVFAKDEQANLTNEDRNQYRAVLEEFERYLRENWAKGWTP
jgi:hypothetical protein